MGKLFYDKETGRLYEVSDNHPALQQRPPKKKKSWKQKMKEIEQDFASFDKRHK